MNSEKLKNKAIKKRFDGFATEEGQFFLAPPTGTFVTGYYPKLYKAYVIVILEERKR